MPDRVFSGYATATTGKAPVRVIGGTFRSRMLQAPAGQATRPTSDRLRETLFNVLTPDIAGAVFLDLYAGSGAVGIEAASRGASEVWFAENGRAAQTALRNNLRALGLSASVVTAGVAALLRQFSDSGHRADLVFLDPPWDDEAAYAATLGALGKASAGLLADAAVVVAEHRSKTPPAEYYGRLRRYRLLKQGDAALSFYKLSETMDEG